MLKGFIVIFTAIISYFMFKRRFTRLQILGIGSVVIGLLLVGLCNIHSYNPKCKTIRYLLIKLFNLVAPRPMLGNSLVILGQFFLAGMFVYEEKILKEYDVNLNSDFNLIGARV
jgi:drug/metabolite transporter (DMT)-like permease